MLLRPPGRSAEPGPCAPPSPQLPVHTHLLSSVLPEATRSFLGISQSLLSHCDTPGPWHLSPHPPSFPELPRAPQTLAPSHSAVVTELPATWETRCPLTPQPGRPMPPFFRRCPLGSTWSIWSLALTRTSSACHPTPWEVQAVTGRGLAPLSCAAGLRSGPPQNP